MVVDNDSETVVDDEMVNETIVLVIMLEELVVDEFALAACAIFVWRLLPRCFILQPSTPYGWAGTVHKRYRTKPA